MYYSSTNFMLLWSFIEKIRFLCDARSFRKNIYSIVALLFSEAAQTSTASEATHR